MRLRGGGVRTKPPCGRSTIVQELADSLFPQTDPSSACRRARSSAFGLNFPRRWSPLQVSMRHRLQQRTRQTFGQRRKNKHIQALEDCRNVLSETEKTDLRSHTHRLNFLPERLHLGASNSQYKDRLRISLHNTRCRFYKIGMSFYRIEVSYNPDHRNVLHDAKLLPEFPTVSGRGKPFRVNTVVDGH